MTEASVYNALACRVLELNIASISKHPDFFFVSLDYQTIMIFAFVFVTSSVLAVVALAFLYYRRRKNYESPNPLTGLCVRYVLKCMYSDFDERLTRI